MYFATIFRYASNKIIISFSCLAFNSLHSWHFLVYKCFNFLILKIYIYIYLFLILHLRELPAPMSFLRWILHPCWTYPTTTYPLLCLCELCYPYCHLISISSKPSWKYDNSIELQQCSAVQCSYVLCLCFYVNEFVYFMHNQHYLNGAIYVQNVKMWCNNG